MKKRQNLSALNAVLFLSILITAFLSMSLLCFASDVQIRIDGKNLEFNSSTGAPFIDSANRTQVPLRVTMETCGCSVDWNSGSRTAVVEKNGIVVQVPIGQNYILVNGQKKANDTAAMIKNDRTYLPIRAVLEAFGAAVSWDNNSRTVIVSSDNIETAHVNCVSQNLIEYVKKNGTYYPAESKYEFSYKNSSNRQYISYTPEGGKLELKTVTNYPARHLTTTDILVLDSSKYPCTQDETYFNCFSTTDVEGGKTYSAQGTISKRNFIPDKTNHFNSINTQDETVKRISSAGTGISLLYLEEYCLLNGIDFTILDLGYKNVY
ncbi:MAG: copper amine oxidase N-terminal domain-containing protein [Bacillota bacterium]|nr:copper amine oxidase N-terminal domain-containing protein [Bacillota bacterium]